MSKNLFILLYNPNICRYIRIKNSLTWFNILNISQSAWSLYAATNRYFFHTWKNIFNTPIYTVTTLVLHTSVTFGRQENLTPRSDTSFPSESLCLSLHQHSFSLQSHTDRREVRHIEGHVAVTCYEGQRLMSVLQQLYLGDISLH